MRATMSSKRARTPAASKTNKSNKENASSNGPSTKKADRPASCLDQQLSSLFRTALILEDDMPLVFDTAEYEETGIYATIGVRASPDDEWRYGTFVPAEAVLHARGYEQRTLLTVGFKGEIQGVQTYLPGADFESWDDRCYPVGPKHVAIGLQADSGPPAQRVCVLEFRAPQPRDAFLARARAPEAGLGEFGLHVRADAAPPPARRPVMAVPDDLDGWMQLQREGRLEDLAMEDIRTFVTEQLEIMELSLKEFVEMHDPQQVPPVSAVSTWPLPAWLQLLIWLLWWLSGC